MEQTLQHDNDLELRQLSPGTHVLPESKHRRQRRFVPRACLLSTDEPVVSRRSGEAIPSSLCRLRNRRRLTPSVKEAERTEAADTITIQVLRRAAKRGAYGRSLVTISVGVRQAV